jgi:hypothetical protein
MWRRLTAHYWGLRGMRGACGARNECESRRGESPLRCESVGMGSIVGVMVAIAGVITKHFTEAGHLLQVAKCSAARLVRLSQGDAPWARKGRTHDATCWYIR